MAGGGREERKRGDRGRQALPGFLNLSRVQPLNNFATNFVHFCSSWEFLPLCCFSDWDGKSSVSFVMNKSAFPIPFDGLRRWKGLVGGLLSKRTNISTISILSSVCVSSSFHPSVYVTSQPANQPTNSSFDQHFSCQVGRAASQRSVGICQVSWKE